MIRRALYDASTVAVGAPVGLILAVIVTAVEKLRAWTRSAADAARRS